MTSPSRRHSSQSDHASRRAFARSFTDLVLVSTGAAVIFASLASFLAGKNSTASVVAAVFGLAIGVWVWKKNRGESSDGA